MSDNSYIHKFDKQMFQGQGYSQFVPNSRELKQGPWIQPHQYIRRTVLHIDSKDRFFPENGGPKQNPNPNKYSIKLPTVFKDVLTVELLEGDFPRTDERLFINKFKYQLTIGGTTYDVPLGAYDNLANLITAINTAIAASTVVLSETAPGSGILEFSAGASLDFSSGQATIDGTSLHSILGFKTNDLPSAVNTAPFSHHLDCENSLLIISPQLQHVEAINPNVAKAFSIIKFEVPVNERHIFNAGDYPAIKLFEPVDSLQRLDFEFRNSLGELYNFQGCEHSMTLEIREVRQNNN